ASGKSQRANGAAPALKARTASGRRTGASMGWHLGRRSIRGKPRASRPLRAVGAGSLHGCRASLPARCRSPTCARSSPDADSLKCAARVAEACPVASGEAAETTIGAGAVLSLDQAGACGDKLRENLEKALRGKPEVVRRTTETLVAGGHLLL